MAVPTINHRGKAASEYQDKIDMLAKTSFPLLAHYGGDEGQEGPPDRAFMVISVEWVRGASQDTSGKKSSVPDGVSLLAIKCLSDWDPSRITYLIENRICPGIHLDYWKLTKGVIIPKLSRGDYSVAKA